MEQDKEAFQCDICKKVFKQKSHLKMHQERKNKCVPIGESKYQCDICGKKFSRKTHFDLHLNRKNKCSYDTTVNRITDLLNKQREDIKQQQEEINLQQQKEMKLQLQKLLNLQMIVPEKTNATPDNSNNNNTTNTNSHNTQTTNNQTNLNSNNTTHGMNNSCLINYVVNNYPNAKNIEDCIKIENIPKMTLIECEDLYFTDGAMKIFKGLCNLGEENRPIHCTDASRCNYIYKSNDVWKIDVGGEAIRNHFFPVIQEAYTQVHKERIKNNPGNSTIIGNYLTEMTGTNVKKICQKTLKKLSNDFLAKNSKSSKLIANQIKQS
jgi:Zinc finger, C2H2 type